MKRKKIEERYAKQMKNFRKQFPEVKPGVFRVTNGVTIRACQCCERLRRFKYDTKIKHSRCTKCGKRNIPEDILEGWKP